MGEFDSLWTIYWLKGNPFFTEPLEIEGSLVSAEDLVGRQDEKQQLTTLIRLGGGTRVIIYGNPGVGKTSLVNYIRAKARNDNFITPLREISVPINGNPQQTIVDTLVLLYDEVEQKKIKINPDLKKRLDYLKPIAELENFEGEGSQWLISATSALIQIFKSLTSELKSLGYPPVILHYNNLDKIKDEEKLSDFFQEFREFVQNQNAIFIFIGDKLVHDVITREARLRQIFTTPLEIGKLSLVDVENIIEERISLLKISSEKTIPLYEEDVIKTLYDLFDGNIRDILNSMSTAFQSFCKTNIPKPISISELKEILYNNVNKNYLEKLTNNERKVLKIILDKGRITPTELSNLSGKTIQNISTYYWRRFFEIGAIELLEISGRQKFYGVIPQIKWWKLEKSQKEIEEENIKKEKNMKELSKLKEKLLYDKRLSDFI